MGSSCLICFDELVNKVQASPDVCDHVFCLTCLERWSKLGSFCPVDRKRFRKVVNLESGDKIQVKRSKRKRTKILYDFSAKCEICSKDENPGVLLLCDCCDLGFHCSCLTPPVTDIPAGLWFCPDCVHVEKNLREKKGFTKDIEADFGYEFFRNNITSSSTQSLLPHEQVIKNASISLVGVSKDHDSLLSDLTYENDAKNTYCSSSRPSKSGKTIVSSIVPSAEILILSSESSISTEPAIYFDKPTVVPAIGRSILPSGSSILPAGNSMLPAGSSTLPAGSSISSTESESFCDEPTVVPATESSILLSGNSILPAGNSMLPAGSSMLPAGKLISSTESENFCDKPTVVASTESSILPIGNSILPYGSSILPAGSSVLSAQSSILPYRSENFCDEPTVVPDTESLISPTESTNFFDKPTIVPTTARLILSTESTSFCDQPTVVSFTGSSILSTESKFFCDKPTSVPITESSISPTKSQFFCDKSTLVPSAESSILSAESSLSSTESSTMSSKSANFCDKLNLVPSNSPIADISETNHSFCVFECTNDVQASQKKYLNVPTLVGSLLSSGTNHDHCSFCKDLISYSSQQLCKICKVKHLRKSSGNDHLKKSAKHTDSFSSGFYSFTNNFTRSLCKGKTESQLSSFKERKKLQNLCNREERRKKSLHSDLRRMFKNKKIVQSRQLSSVKEAY